MRMAKIKAFSVLLITALFALPFVSCSGTKWNVSWPTYTNVPMAKDSIAFFSLNDVFTLMRAKWFSNKLHIPEDSTYTLVTHFVDSTFASELKKFYPNAVLLKQSPKKQFAQETQKLDDRIFIKGYFPAQGEILSAESGDAPPYLLLIHEFTISGDLKRETFFDYSLTSREAPEKQAIQNLTAIISWTLWDNLKQIPLYSSAMEIQVPALQTKTETLLSTITQSSVDAIVKEIATGSHK